MKNKIEVNQTDYSKFKDNVENGVSIQRIKVLAGDLIINDFESILIKRHDNAQVRLETLGLSRSLFNLFGLGNTFASLMDNLFDKNGKKAALNFLSQAIYKHRSKPLVISYNVDINKVVNCYFESDKSISDSHFFAAVEKIINSSPDIGLRSIDQDLAGNLNAVIFNDSLEFDFKGKSDEVFKCGNTISLKKGKLTSSFFTERLVCSNGMAIKDKLCSSEVSLISNLAGFLSAVISNDYVENNIAAFKSRINRTYYTTASLNEVIRIGNSLRSILGEKNYDLIGETSYNRMKRAFNSDYMEARDSHKFLKTDRTIWEIANEITAISSKIEQDNLFITAKDNLKIQMLGGNLLFKTPDLPPNNIKQIF